MVEWFADLDTASKVFLSIATVFSVFFVWQFIMTILGMTGGGGDMEAGADVGEVSADFDAEGFSAEIGEDVAVDVGGDVGGDFDADAGDLDVESAMSFKLLSFRSVIAFGMLFGWAGVLYRHEGRPVDVAILYSLAWAAAGGLLVSTLLYFMKRMQETGTRRLATCVGRPSTVYMDIPARGTGKIRTVVSGAVSFVPARSADGKRIPAGTPVEVTRQLDHATVEVKRLES